MAGKVKVEDKGALGSVPDCFAQSDSDDSDDTIRANLQAACGATPGAGRSEASPTSPPSTPPASPGPVDVKKEIHEIHKAVKAAGSGSVAAHVKV